MTTKKNMKMMMFFGMFIYENEARFVDLLV